MFNFTHKGNFNNLQKFLNAMTNDSYLNELESLGQKGVEALQRMTPKDTGLTASSWTFEISKKKNVTTLSWLNENIQNGVNIAVLIQYGHGTPSGTYIEGVDYINPALAPVFQEIADKAWKVVTTS